MEKFIYYNELFSIYQNLLSDKTKEIFNYYYAENLSMQEIADLCDVSKSFVGSCIKKAEKKLEELEQELKIYNNKKIVEKVLLLDDIKEIKNALNSLK